MMKKNEKSRNISIKSNNVEFKPGNKPYCYFGKQVLNKDVPWVELVIDILDKGYSLNKITAYAETTFQILREVIQLNYDVLPFRAGARIVALHYRLCPQCYRDSC